MRSRASSDRSDRSSMIGRSETSSLRCTGGCCSVKARAPRRNTTLSVDVRKSCARVTSASLQAKMLMMICSSEVRAIHSSRAFARLTHLCRADQAEPPPYCRARPGALVAG